MSTLFTNRDWPWLLALAPQLESVSLTQRDQQIDSPKSREFATMLSRCRVLSVIGHQSEWMVQIICNALVVEHLLFAGRVPWGGIVCDISHVLTSNLMNTVTCENMDVTDQFIHFLVKIFHDRHHTLRTLIFKQCWLPEARSKWLHLSIFHSVEYIEVHDNFFRYERERLCSHLTKTFASRPRIVFK